MQYETVFKKEIVFHVIFMSSDSKNHVQGNIVQK